MIDKKENYTGAKYDAGKARMDLIEPEFELGLAQVMTKGAETHGAYSWQTVPNAEQRYLAALKRHTNAIARGELIDSESGEYHADHIAANAMFLRWFHARTVKTNNDKAAELSSLLQHI
jgi:hypothetical protein